jgi:hypothetical protein
MSRIGFSLLGILTALSLLAPPAGAAPPPYRLELGWRGGFSNQDRFPLGFEQHEVFAGVPVTRLGSLGAWAPVLELSASLGHLSSPEGATLVAAVGPSFALYRDHRGFTLKAGVSPSLLSHRHHGSVDFGTRFQFTSHLEAGVRLGRGLGIAYRFQHMSNAAIRQPNPGLDLHMLQVSVRL